MKSTVLQIFSDFFLSTVYLWKWYCSILGPMYHPCFPCGTQYAEYLAFHYPLIEWLGVTRLFHYKKKMWIGGSMTEAGYGDKMDIVRIMIEWDITQHQSLGWKRGYALNITEMIFFDILWPILLCSSWASPLEWDSTWFHG